MHDLRNPVLIPSTRRSCAMRDRHFARSFSSCFLSRGLPGDYEMIDKQGMRYQGRESQDLQMRNHFQRTNSRLCVIRPNSASTSTATKMRNEGYRTWRFRHRNRQSMSAACTALGLEEPGIDAAELHQRKGLIGSVLDSWRRTGF